MRRNFVSFYQPERQRMEVTHYCPDRVYSLTTADKFGRMPERKAVEVRVFDNVPKFKYDIVAWELRGEGRYLDEDRRWRIIPLSQEDLRYNLGVYCRMMVYQLELNKNQWRGII